MPKISTIAQKICGDKMRYRNRKSQSCPALTILEIIIALAIITIIFAAVLPQFRVIYNSWDSRQAGAEVLQNGRVLIDHISRNLSKAVKITAVSDSNQTSGFIVFQDNDSNNWRYDINTTSNYIEFGPVGYLSDLAGPVNSLTFTCYDACDLNTPLSSPIDVNSIRFVDVETTLPNPATLGQNKTFTASVYLRTNAYNGGIVGCWKLDETSGTTAADLSGKGNNGTLVNMTPPGCWVTGQIGNALAFDGTNDYVDLGTDSSLNFGSSGPFTVAAWVKTTENYGMIVSFRSSTDGGPVIDLAVGYEGGADDPGKAMILVRQDGGSGGYAHVKGGAVNDGLWHHVAAVRGSGSTIELFLDGVSQGTNSGAESGGAITTNLRAIGSERRWVNDSFGTADQRYLAGTIDDVRLYNRALGAAEIATLANILTYKGFSEGKVPSDSNTTIVIPKPSGTVQNDLLIAAVATDESSTPFTASGWTPIDCTAYGTAVTLGTWRKTAGASEPASYNFSWTGGQQAYGWMMRFSGHNSTNPINGTPATANQTSATPTSPAVTTTVPNCLILRLGAFDDSGITVGSPGLLSPLHTPITMNCSGSSGINTVGILGSWVTGTTHAKESGTNRALVFIAHVEEGGAITLNSVTYGGQTMTKVIDRIVDTTTRAYVVAYILNEAGVAAATSGTFAPTWSTTPDYVAYASVFLRNVNQTTLIGASASNGTTSGNTITTSALATSNGDMVIDAATCGNTGSYTINNGFTEGTDQTMGDTATGATGYKSATGVAETPSVTHSGANRQVLIGFVVQSAGAVSGGAGYIKQSNAGLSSGTPTFQLTASNEARMLTIAIAPDVNGSYDCCGDYIQP
jgi:type II secretory pathway pseudopilin PulG